MIVKILGGLYLFDQSAAPDGACIRAKNVIFDRDGIVETRKGSSKGSITASSRVLNMLDHSGDRYSWASTGTYKNETSFGDTLTAARPEAVRYNAWNSSTDSVFFLNGTDRKRIEGASMYEWGITAPATVPTVAAGSGTGLTGAYNVKYTYVRKESSVIVYESNLSSTAAAAVTLADEDLDVTFTASADTQVTHVRVYRTTAGGSTYYQDTDVAVGTLTATLDTTDTLLALNTAAHSDNHDRPPLGTHCAGPLQGGYVFIGIDNLLYWCLAKQPEYWPTTNFIEISEPQDAIQAITDFGGTVFAFTREKIVQVQGSGSNTFAPINLEAFCGTYSQNCVKVVPNKGVYHLGKDGIYLFRGVDQKAFPHLDPIFDQKSADGLPNLDLSKIANCWMESFGDALYFGYPSTSASTSYPDTIVRLNTDNNKMSRFVYSGTFTCTVVDRTNMRLYAGDSSGYVWQLDTGATDGGTAIATEVETAQVNLPTREFSPKWCRHDTYCDSKDTLNADVIIDGTSAQTHALSNKDRDTRPRLIANTVGNRVAVRYTGSGDSIKIYAQQEIE